MFIPLYCNNGIKVVSGKNYSNSAIYVNYILYYHKQLHICLIQKVSTQNKVDKISNKTINSHTLTQPSFTQADKSVH